MEHCAVVQRRGWGGDGDSLELGDLRGKIPKKSSYIGVGTMVVFSGILASIICTYVIAMLRPSEFDRVNSIIANPLWRS